MTLSPESQKTVDAYLASLRKRLRAMPVEDTNDIVEEIHAHILDKSAVVGAEGMLDATLAALGTADELAARYRTDDLLKRAQITRSPVVSLFSLARWATMSLIGLGVFVLSVAAYGIGALLLLVGLLKLIYPRSGGLWFDPKPGGHGMDGTAGFSFGSPLWTHPGHEVFGLWLGPTCLALGGLLIFLTFRLGTWCIRRFWRPSALRG